MGPKATRIINVGTNFKVWRIQGFAVGAETLNGSPDASTIFKTILKRQKEAILIDEMDKGRDGSMLTGVRRAGMVFGCTDCMGDELGNINLDDKRQSYIEELASGAGVSLVSEDDVDDLQGIQGHYLAKTIESAIATLPTYPAYLGSNKTATDRAVNRSVLLVELPLPSPESDIPALKQQQQKDQRTRVRERYESGWLSAIGAGSQSGFTDCFLKKATPYLIDRIVNYIDVKAMPDNNNDAYLPGLKSEKGCVGVSHRGGKSETFCEWYDMARQGYIDGCLNKGIKPWNCKPVEPPITPQYVSKELFHIFRQASLTRASLATQANEVAQEVYDGVYNFWHARLDATDGNTGDHPAVRSMLLWFLGRQFHIVGGQVANDKPNEANIYSCFESTGLFDPDYTDFTSDYINIWGDTIGAPY